MDYGRVTAIRMKNTLWLILISFFAGCASINPALLTEDDMVHVVGIAREKASTEITDLSEEELYLLKSEHPKYLYYKLSGNYADYYFYWDIKDNQRIVVYGRGDIMTLEGAKVKRFKGSNEGKY